MRSSAGWLLMSLFVVGCAPGMGDDLDDSDEDLLGSAEDAVEAPNAIAPNAIAPNAIAPNAIAPNAIAPNALTAAAIASSAMTALQDPGEAGSLSRLHVKYAVSCAFNSSQSFSFSWTDAQSVVHDETYWGLLALAPDWATRGLTDSEQRWVSACMGARTNYFAATVHISMRGGHASLTTDATERTEFSAREGAFWGNIYAATPYLKSCYDDANVDNSRNRQRECAAGYLDGEDTLECGIIDITGSCSSICSAPGQTGDGFPACDDISEAITTYLPPPPT